MTQQRVAVVMSGAAARGAFQAGALARVMDLLADDGVRPTVFIGTSAGGINAALWGSFADQGVKAAGRSLTDTWRSMDRGDVYAHPLTTVVKDGLRFLPGSLLGRGDGLPALLDTTPLRRTAEEMFDPARLARNVAEGVIEGVGVAATRVPGTAEPIASGRSVVFLDTRLPTAPVADPLRAVEVAPGPVTADQVIASAAIPVAFPAPFVGSPAAFSGWYLDGGTRLNAPLRPAVALGADRIIVIAANSTDYGPRPAPAPADQPWPDITDATAMVLHTVLADRMIEDLHDLRVRNEWARERNDYRKIEFLTISPEPGALADLAAVTIAGKRRSWWRRWPIEGDDLALERLLRGLGEGSGQRELLSYVLFDKQYFAAQLEIGASAADAAFAQGWAT